MQLYTAPLILAASEGPNETKGQKYGSILHNFKFVLCAVTLHVFVFAMLQVIAVYAKVLFVL